MGVHLGYTMLLSTMYHLPQSCMEAIADMTVPNNIFNCLM